MRNAEISLVSGEEVSAIVGLMEDLLGTDSIEEVLQAGGFSSRWKSDADAYLPNAEYVRLLELVARQSNQPLLGAILGDALPFAELGSFGRYAMSAPTSAEALRRAARTLKYHENGSSLRLSIQGDRFDLRYQPPTPRALGSRQQCDGVAALLMNLIRSFEGPDWRPAVLRIAAANGARAEHLSQFFCVDVEGIETGVEMIGCLTDIVSGSLDGSSGSDPFTFSDLRNLAESKPPSSFSDAFSLALQNFVKDGITDLGEISDQLHLERRTLQRRLKAEGRSFGEMLEETRRQVAEDFLFNTEAKVAEIAKKVGYTSKQHFIRAFKKWTGMTPGSSRRMSRKN
ncbi:HTH-type transcriptional regulator VirS (plasmid) [Pseudoseohaeicola sp. NH-UV-7]|uniref:AraC family transcriptional regulator n=1 Tax=unclassified Sulfitobacter TaxID=196795 RepID=UPI000E09F61C|nr:AraC family transcriptional regulator [Sulfitobacter sp. JL08]AXI56437.1 hypothetical protein C1J05_19720 [Sulfitobacter sp. JL08]